MAAIRQLTAMESSIDYIMSHTEQSLKYLNEKEFETLLNNIKEKICKIKRIGKALKTLTEHVGDNVFFVLKNFITFLSHCSGNWFILHQI